MKDKWKVIGVTGLLLDITAVFLGRDMTNSVLTFGIYEWLLVGMCLFGIALMSLSINSK